jgi:hypothetical protein
VSSARTAGSALPRERQTRQWSRYLRVSPVSLGVVLVATLGLAYYIGSQIPNLNATRAVAVFAIGVVSFLGMLSLAHRGARRGRYDSSEVRIAVTTAFTMVYFAALGIFLFSTNTVSTFGQSLMSSLTSLFGVVVGFYFASSAVVEYGRTRGPTSSAQPAAPDEAADAGAGDPAALEVEVRALREIVTRLVAQNEGGTSGTKADSPETAGGARADEKATTES